MPVETRTVTIASPHGLHARPAKMFVQAAKDAGIAITIAKDGGKAIDAGSILSVLALGAVHGDTVTLTAEGDNAAAVLDELQTILETDHDTE